MSETQAQPAVGPGPVLEIVFEDPWEVSESWGPEQWAIRVMRNSVIRIAGVRVTTELLQQVFVNPPEGSYSFKRTGDTITVTREDTK